MNSGLQRTRHFGRIMTMTLMSLAPLACASLTGADPLNVTVAGVEPLASQGMEAQLLVKLRVQNPNDTPLDYDGVALEFDVRGNTFAIGVSSAGGSVPRFSEVIIDVPVTVSAFRMLGQAIDMMRSDVSRPVTYEMKGKLNTADSRVVRFRTKGEFQLPAMKTSDGAG